MDAFLEYATLLDPELPSRIEGATPAELGRVQAALKVPLPSDYRKFLELMGRRDDGIIEGDDVSTSAAEIAAFYETNGNGGAFVIPNDGIVLGIGGAAIDLVCIDLEPPHRVHEVCAGRRVKQWAASLRGLLYQQVFMRAAAQRYAHTTVFTTGEKTPRLRDAESFVEGLGLARQWFSDESTSCYASDDEAAVLHQFPDEGFAIRLSTNRDASRLADLGARWRLK